MRSSLLSIKIKSNISTIVVINGLTITVGTVAAYEYFYDETYPCESIYGKGYNSSPSCTDKNWMKTGVDIWIMNYETLGGAGTSSNPWILG